MSDNLSKKDILLMIQGVIAEKDAKIEELQDRVQYLEGYVSQLGMRHDL